MSEPPPSRLLTLLTSLLGQISGSVVALLAYLMAISGRTPGPFPRATALATVVVTTSILWAWRWQVITQTKSVPKSAFVLPPNIRPPSAPSFHRLDILRASNDERYVLSSTRRRQEFSSLCLLTLLAVFWSIYITPSVVREIAAASGDPALPMECLGSTKTTALRIVIADFKKASQAPALNQEDRLFDQLTSNVTTDTVTCRISQVVANRSEAQRLGKQAQAALIIWGRVDVAVYEVNVEVASWAVPNRTLPARPTEEISSFSFQMQDAQWIGFLSQFTLSQMLYLDHHPEQARDLLGRVLEEAPAQKHPSDLAEAYFFLGLLYDTHISTTPDLQRAIQAYSQAVALDHTLYAAILNRALVYTELDQTSQAMADYALLIESNSPLAGTAYASRALLYEPAQRDLAERDLREAIRLNPVDGLATRGSLRLNEWNDVQGAIADFQQAVQLDPKEPSRYHDLGQAQLTAGQFDAAIQTYRNAEPFLSIDSRDEIINDLKSIADASPELQQVISVIVAHLQALNLPAQQS